MPGPPFSSESHEDLSGSPLKNGENLTDEGPRLPALSGQMANVPTVSVEYLLSIQPNPLEAPSQKQDLSERRTGTSRQNEDLKSREAEVVHVVEVLEVLKMEQVWFQQRLQDWISRFGDDLQTRMITAITQIPASTAFNSYGLKIAGQSDDYKEFSGSIEVSGDNDAMKTEPVSASRQDYNDETNSNSSRGRGGPGSLHRAHSKGLKNVVVHKILSAEGEEQTLRELRTSDAENEARMQKTTSRIVCHPLFNVGCSMMILGNSLLVGISTQYGTFHDSRNDTYEQVGYFFSAFFFTEMLLRMDTAGVIQYFIGFDYLWNVFDFLLVLMSIVDFLLTLTTSDESFSTNFLTLKAVRIARIFRVFRFFNELSMLVILIANSVKSLIWALTLLSIIIYVFSILLTQNATYTIRHDDPLRPEVVKKYFGDLQTSVYTLVLSTLNGISWVEVSDVCLELGAMTTALFFSYIFFAHLAVLNIITAVFVDHAMERAKSERELMVQKEIDNKAGLAKQLIGIFNELDADHSGDVSWKELTTFFEDERARVHFAALGLSTDDLRRLWNLLDLDDTGCVHLHEFLEGCMHVRGAARSIDLQCLMKRCKLIEKRIASLPLAHVPSSPLSPSTARFAE